MFFAYEESKETRRGGGEKEDMRRSQTVYMCVCVCVCVSVCDDTEVISKQTPL